MAEAKVLADVPGAYRQPGERPRLLDSERRWFTKTGEVQKGPYAPDVLARSIKSGVLRRTSLVRAEDETEWRPVYAVEALRPVLQGPRGPGWTTPRDDDGRYEDHGAFGGGFAAGFFGGIIGLLLVLALAKGPQTKRGARTGFLVALGIGLSLRALLALAN